MEISGISSGVVATTAANNGNANITEVEKKSSEIESQTTTQISEAVPQPTQASDGGTLGSNFDATA